MAKVNVNCISFNANGLTNLIKRVRILARVRKEQANIVYLQEMYLNNSKHEKLQ